MTQRYKNVYTAFGDAAIMTYDEFVRLAAEYPEWNLSADKFSLRADGRVYYDNVLCGVPVYDICGQLFDWYTIVDYMDDDIREEIHSDLPNLTEAAFVAEYLSRHEAAFGEIFTIGCDIKCIILIDNYSAVCADDDATIDYVFDSKADAQDYIDRQTYIEQDSPFLRAEIRAATDAEIAAYEEAKNDIS